MEVETKTLEELVIESYNKAIYYDGFATFDNVLLWFEMAVDTEVHLDISFKQAKDVLGIYLNSELCTMEIEVL